MANEEDVAAVLDEGRSSMQKTLERFGLKKHSEKKSSVRLDTMDKGTRRKMESANITASSD